MCASVATWACDMVTLLPARHQPDLMGQLVRVAWVDAIKKGAKGFLPKLVWEMNWEMQGWFPHSGKCMKKQPAENV